MTLAAMTAPADGPAAVPVDTGTDGAAWGVRWLGDRTAFGLWAPSVGTAAVLGGDGAAHPMARLADGWHAVSLPGFPPGSRYKFQVDAISVPDPASRYQPDGPDGFSEVVDPGGYVWKDGSWRGRPWAETVLYELHIGTFSQEGTFLGAIAHLEHLQALGVTMIEVMPVGAFPGLRNWGYDGVLPWAPDADYGTPDDLRRLVDECHSRGISVVMDVVYNHFGPQSNTLHSYLPEFFTDRHHTPWGSAIAFDRPGSASVRDYYVANALYWLTEFHMDGLRLDAVQAILDDSPEHILDEMTRRIRAALPGRTVHLTLENDNNEARWLEPAQGADAMRYEAQWNDDFHHAMRVLVTGRRDGYYRDYADDPLRRLGCALAEGFSYQGEESKHRPGLVRGTKSGHLPAMAFVSFIQNHDQVGNTPFGKRITALAPAAAVRLGTAVMLLAPAIPMLFMGQEWGSARPFDFFCDFPEPLAGLVRNGRREEFSHLPELQDPELLAKLADPGAAATRDACVLDWDAVASEPHAGWLAFHRQLLEVRRRVVVPVLAGIGGGAGTFHVAPSGDGTGVVEARWALPDGRRLVLTANFGDAPAVWTVAGEQMFRLAADASADGLAAWDLVLAVETS